MILPQLSIGKSLGGFNQLPGAAQHVRHGLYQLEPIKSLFLPKWIEFFQPHQFFGNGVEPSNTDLTIYNFKLADEPVVIGIQEDQLHVTVEGSSASVGMHQLEEETLALQLSASSRYTVRLIGKQKLADEHSAKDRILLIHSGSFNIANETFEAGEFVHLSESDDLTIERLTPSGIAIALERAA